MSKQTVSGTNKSCLIERKGLKKKCLKWISLVWGSCTSRCLKKMLKQERFEKKMKKTGILLFDIHVIKQKWHLRSFNLSIYCIFCFSFQSTNVLVARCTNQETVKVTFCRKLSIGLCSGLQNRNACPWNDYGWIQVNAGWSGPLINVWCEVRYSMWGNQYTIWLRFTTSPSALPSSKNVCRGVRASVKVSPFFIWSFISWIWLYSQGRGYRTGKPSSCRGPLVAMMSPPPTIASAWSTDVPLHRFCL